MDSFRIGRIAYIVPAVLVDLVFIYFVVNFGATNEEKFGSFLMRSWMLIGSLALAIPLFPYVVWKFVKQRRPIFWTIALVIASLPIILTLVGGL